MSRIQKIAPFLWFDRNAEEAANYYVSIFKNSRILEVLKNTGAAPGEPGSVLTIAFELEGLRFVGINGGPLFQFSEAVSFAVSCEDQNEIDDLWEKLCDGGQPSQCGWLKDRFGLSWQIIPRQLPEMMMDPDPACSHRVMQAVMQMTKLDLATLQAAYRGE
ncbi:VOC family protein [Planctomicrobium sp. SH664]|uniref:VOC family protein n=1 Tax=Planctomicrobium sp. SH664 TaxID=3448125 RepID=UPI003F5B90BC